MLETDNLLFTIFTGYYTQRCESIVMMWILYSTNTFKKWLLLLSSVCCYRGCQNWSHSSKSGGGRHGDGVASQQVSCMVSLREVFLSPNITELMYLCRQCLGFVVTRFVLKPMVRISGAICILLLYLHFLVLERC